MDEERIKILKMLEEGKIKAEEAERLLDALSGGSEEREFSRREKKRSKKEKKSSKKEKKHSKKEKKSSAEMGRCLRVQVWEGDSEKPTKSVRLPLSLIKWGMKYAPEFTKVKLTHGDIAMEGLERAIAAWEDGDEVTIAEVDDKDTRVRVWVE